MKNFNSRAHTRRQLKFSTQMTPFNQSLVKASEFSSLTSAQRFTLPQVENRSDLFRVYSSPVHVTFPFRSSRSILLRKNNHFHSEHTCIAWDYHACAKYHTTSLRAWCGADDALNSSVHSTYHCYLLITLICMHLHATYR